MLESYVSGFHSSCEHLLRAILCQSLEILISNINKLIISMELMFYFGIQQKEKYIKTSKNKSHDENTKGILKVKRFAEFR